MRILGLWIRWGCLILVIGTVVGGIYYYSRLNEEIRCHCELKIANQYKGLSVAVRSARLLEGKGIEIRGLSISLPGADRVRGELAYVDEIIVHCDPTIQRLVHNELEPTHISINRLKIRSVYLGDGKWTGHFLIPMTKLDGRPVPVTVSDGTIEFFDPTHRPASTYTLRDVNLTFKPYTSPSADPGAADRPSVFLVEGTLAGDHFQKAVVQGAFCTENGSCTLTGNIQQLEISPQWRQSLPAPIASHLEMLGSLRAQAELNFRIQREKTDTTPRFEVCGNVTQGRYEDPRLPYPISDLLATVRVSNDRLQIEKLTAMCGQGRLQLSCMRDGFSASSPMRLNVSAERVVLDRYLLETLPEGFRDTWQRLQPSGEVNADLDLFFDGHRWVPNLSMQCLDLAFMYYKFPYRLEHGNGTITLRDKELTFRLMARAGGQPVRITGDVTDPGPAYGGVIEVASEGSIAIDDQLTAALPEKGQEILRAFHPQGKFDFSSRVEREPGLNGVKQQHILIRLHDGQIRHDRFPYPLDRISGAIEIVDDRWWFRDLHGRNDSGYVTCQGGWTKQDGVGRLWLDFVGTDIPLEEELRDAFEPKMRGLWSLLQPRGTVDHVAVKLRYESDPVSADAGRVVPASYQSERKEGRLSIEVEGQKWPASQNVEGRELSVHATFFPYKLEQITGRFQYRDGRMELTGLRARHGQTNVSGDANVEIQPDGRWQFVMHPLSVDRLPIDRELIDALPRELGEQLATMQIGGPIDLHGGIEFSRDGSNGVLTSQWDFGIELEDCRFGYGFPLEHLFGSLRLRGGSTDKMFQCRGRVELDSLMYRNIQLSQVRGPIWIDNSRILLGSWAEPRNSGQAPQQLTASVFGGTVSGDAQISLVGSGRYDLQVNLVAAELDRLIRETSGVNHPVTGKVFAGIHFGGGFSGIHTLSGGGNIRLRDANIYELPVMVALLKILRIQQPDRTAFTTSDIDFRLQGDHIYLDRVNLNGDAVSLKGNGEANLNRTVDLNFYTIVGRDEVQIPIVKPLLGEAARQLMQIHVTGTLDNPQMTREVLPGINESLQHLFPEEQLEPAQTGLLPRPGEMLDRLRQ